MGILFWETEGKFKKTPTTSKEEPLLCNVCTVLSKIELSFHFVCFNEMLYLKEFNSDKDY